MSVQRRGRTQAETARLSVATEALNYVQQTLTSPDKIFEHMRSQETSAGLVDWLKLVFSSKPDQIAGGEEWGSGDPEFHSKSTDIDGPQQASIVPQIRKVGFAAYKNWGVECLDDGHRHKHYAIDVLVGSGTALEKERRLEVKHRTRNDAGDGMAKWNSVSSKPDQVSSLCPHPDEGQIQRVRIQSPAILATLAKAMGESWPAAPRAFIRPFKALIHHHEKMKEALAQLEAKWADDEGSEERSIAANLADDEDGAETPRQRPVDDCVEALRDMQCYVAFVEKDILPLYHQFERYNRSSAQRRIRFDDLWYLFRTGELVYTPIATDSEKANPSSIRQSCWRVCAVYPPHPKYSKPSPWPHKNSRPSGGDEDSSSFSVSCYYVDYSGEDYGVVTEQFFIRPYDGEKDITTLNLFPFRFVEDSELMMEKFKRSGAEFLEYLERKHVSYNWWTITSNPRGDPVTDPDGNEDLPHLEAADIHIEAWRLGLQSRVDEIPIRQWSTDSDTASAYTQLPEIIQVHDGVEAIERNWHIESDEFLRQLLDNEKSGRNTTAVHLPERNLLLLPKRMFAYILRDRKFAQLDHRYMRKPIAGGVQGFTDELKIPKGHKKTIEAIVNAHFMNRSTERQHGVEGLSQDLIPGKGRGRVILLHGVPGVGKTATAETVAQALAKPLFAITCGDLGITPKEVEVSLNEIFRYAHLWDCVLLLDEVDTFFSHRMKPDLARNALVSVFLRVLEYFNGILFVTTNRVGALDEAFKSRIHLSLYYPPLDLPSFRDIWEMNIARLKRIELERCQSTDEPPLQIAEQEIMAFAMEHWHRHKHGQGLWNGRQIRNAFQIAWSLAYYDTRTDYHHETDQHGQSQPQLRARHFGTVSEATRLFDDYLAKAAGKTHPALAYERGERDDKYVHSYEEPYDYHESKFAVPVPVPVPQQRHQGSGGTWNSSYRYMRGGSSGDGGSGVGYPGRPSLGADIVYDHPDAMGLPHGQRQYYDGVSRRMTGYGGGQSPVPGESLLFGPSLALRGREEALPSPFASAMSMTGDSGRFPDNG